MPSAPNLNPPASSVAVHAAIFRHPMWALTPQRGENPSPERGSERVKCVPARAEAAFHGALDRGFALELTREPGERTGVTLADGGRVEEGAAARSDGHHPDMGARDGRTRGRAEKRTRRRFPVNPANRSSQDVTLGLSRPSHAFLSRMFAPTHHVTILLLPPRGGGLPQQRFPSRDGAMSDSFQAWLRHLNARGYNIYFGTNPINPARQRREKQDIAELRHVQIDLDDDGPGSLQRIQAAARPSIQRRPRRHRLQPRVPASRLS